MRSVRNHLVAASACLGLAACMVAPDPLEGWAEVEPPTLVAGETLELVNAFLASRNVAPDHRKVHVRETNLMPEHMVDVTIDGLKDDSVSGMRFRLLVSETVEGLAIRRLGERYVCARGENAGKEQAQLCP